jgi:hypothetical protein
VTVLGVALACAPMAVASAKSKPKHHPKPKHHTTKTVAKAKVGPGSTFCASIVATESSNTNLGIAVVKVIQEAASGNFAGAKQAMIGDMNTALTAEGPAEAELSSAPANVQAALKGLFTFESTLKTDISNASNLEQLATSLQSLGTSTQFRTDALTLATYASAECGTTTTTT